MTEIDTASYADQITPPRIGLFWISIFSLLASVYFAFLSSEAGYIVGYVTAILITFPSGLAFKAQGMNALSVGANVSTFPVFRKATRWVFLASSMLALLCAARFAIAVS